nr:MAG TPA: hypothetical protein [Caudoviricetes sp.]
MAGRRGTAGAFARCSVFEAETTTSFGEDAGRS